MSNLHQQALDAWARQAAAHLGTPVSGAELTRISDDASFRRYYRLRLSEGSFIVVDAPPQHEDSQRFVAIARLFRAADIMVPKVYAADVERGFLLLEDLGDDLYLDSLGRYQAENDIAAADSLYRQAIASLIRLQCRVDNKRLDAYDRYRLREEMALFDQWFCRRLLRLALDEKSLALIHATYQLLEDAALAQPTVAVHRDFHSRNLMLLDERHFPTDAGPGIVDFQDAVSGAYTYDLVSLLRDCYIRWPKEQVRAWALGYLEQARDAGIIAVADADAFLRDFDLMGLQRHLKVMGVFARLSLRDKKSAYLADIPLVIRYFREVAAGHPELAEFLDWFDNRVLPAAASRLDLNY